MSVPMVDLSYRSVLVSVPKMYLRYWGVLVLVRLHAQIIEVSWCLFHGGLDISRCLGLCQTPCPDYWGVLMSVPRVDLTYRSVLVSVPRPTWYIEVYWSWFEKYSETFIVGVSNKVFQLSPIPDPRLLDRLIFRDPTWSVAILLSGILDEVQQPPPPTTLPPPTSLPPPWAPPPLHLDACLHLELSLHPPETHPSRLHLSGFTA